MRPTLLLTLALLAAPTAVAQDDEGKTPVLVVSGANNHDWRWTTPSLVRILEGSGRFDVATTYEPGKDLADREALAGYDAIVLDYNGPRWGEAAEAAFLDAVRGGTGVVVIHAANNAFPGWVEYEELVADLWRRGTGHGRFHPFDVEIVDRDHPVTATLPTIRKHPDELYHRLVNPHGVERRVLATAYSDPETGGTGEHEPMVLVKSYGEGRVFHTPLGHVWSNVAPSQASHRDPQFRGLVVRGTEWAATGEVSDGRGSSALTEGERADGWRSLMSPDAWRGYGKDTLPDGWEFVSDCLVHRARSGAGDVVTVEQFGDFELAFEWKTTRGGNSGVKYRVEEDGARAVAPEYQLLDDSAHEGLPADQRCGALYDVVPAEGASLAPWGFFNASRVEVRGDRVRHWLNGELVVDVEVGSEAWEAAVADSKFAGRGGFGAAETGRILLQDHGDEVWFRALRVRPLREGESILPDDDLAGWFRVGDAVYERDGDTIVGSAGPNRRQSFLVSERTWADFELELELRVEVDGNSGVQFRSHVRDDGGLYGYQAEVDPGGRSWSGGIYDEGRRGWLDDLADDAEARAAFDRNGWNRYRIRAVGPRLTVWVNGVRTADVLDALDLAGHVALQIHGGDEDVRVRWRDVRVTDLGRHEWVVDEGRAGTGGPVPLAACDAAYTRRFRARGACALLLGAETPAGRGGERIALGGGDAWRVVSVIRATDRTVVRVDGRAVHDAPRGTESGKWDVVDVVDGEADSFEVLVVGT